jgi:hypothetical protein
MDLNLVMNVALGILLAEVLRKVWVWVKVRTLGG